MPVITRRAACPALTAGLHNEPHFMTAHARPHQFIEHPQGDAPFDELARIRTTLT